MPEPITTETLPAMIRIVDDFCQDIKNHVEGVPSDNHGLVQSINTKREEFKTAILSLSPKFKPYDPKEKEIRQEFIQAPPIELFDKEKEDPAYSKNSLSLHVDEVMKKIKKHVTSIF